MSTEDSGLDSGPDFNSDASDVDANLDVGSDSGASSVDSDSQGPNASEEPTIQDAGLDSQGPNALETQAQSAGIDSQGPNALETARSATEAQNAMRLKAAIKQAEGLLPSGLDALAGRGKRLVGAWTEEQSDAFVAENSFAEAIGGAMNPLGMANAGFTAGANCIRGMFDSKNLRMSDPLSIACIFIAIAVGAVPASPEAKKNAYEQITSLTTSYARYAQILSLIATLFMPASAPVTATLATASELVDRTIQPVLKKALSDLQIKYTAEHEHSATCKVDPEICDQSVTPANNTASYTQKKKTA